jgi:hypothetical protein
MTTSIKTPSKTLSIVSSKAPIKATSKALPSSTSNAAIKKVAKPTTKTTKATSKPVVATSKAAVVTVKTITKTAAAKTPSAPLAKQLVEKPIKAKKIKLVRDSFTIPKPEYLILDNLKLRAADLKHPVKKSELLRAGIKALAAMTDAQLLLALKAVPMLKTGRPSK